MRLRGRKNIRPTVVASREDASVIILGLGPGTTYEGTVPEFLELEHAIADAIAEAKRLSGGSG